MPMANHHHRELEPYDPSPPQPGESSSTNNTPRLTFCYTANLDVAVHTVVLMDRLHALEKGPVHALQKKPTSPRRATARRYCASTTSAMATGARCKRAFACYFVRGAVASLEQISRFHQGERDRTTPSTAVEKEMHKHFSYRHAARGSLGARSTDCLCPPPPLASTAAVDVAAAPVPASSVTVEQNAHHESQPSKPEDADANEIRENGDEEDSDDEDNDEDAEMLLAGNADDETPLMRDAAYVSLRLTEDERALFNLLDASLNVSAYTDKVDVLSYRSPIKAL